MRKISQSCLIASLLLAGCVQPNPKLLKTEPLTPTESTLQTAVGQTIEVVLPALGSSPTYKWVLEQGYNQTLLRFDSERAAINEYPVRPPPGYAPNRVFVLKALAVGNTSLSFSQQPIEPGSGPVDIKRTFPVEVRDTVGASP